MDGSDGRDPWQMNGPSQRIVECIYKYSTTMKTPLSSYQSSGVSGRLDYYETAETLELLG
jgi:hypothetical protein